MRDQSIGREKGGDSRAHYKCVFPFLFSSSSSSSSLCVSFDSLTNLAASCSSAIDTKLSSRLLQLVCPLAAQSLVICSPLPSLCPLLSSGLNSSGRGRKFRDPVIRLSSSIFGSVFSLSANNLASSDCRPFTLSLIVVFIDWAFVGILKYIPSQKI